MEGGSAVLAGIDLLMQLQHARGQTQRTKVAVSERSYHGSASTSPGAPGAPLWPKDFQLVYPAPTVLQEIDEPGLTDKFTAFLQTHGAQISVMLFEPQWGSSNVSKPWPPALLRRFVDLAHENGILVLCDEIMCGLGRHGLGTCFLTEAWGVDADAVTFGKAVASGVFPLSGVALRKGASELRSLGRGVLQMHTYAGAGQLPLLAGIEVLRLLPAFWSSVADLGKILESRLQDLERDTSGFVRCYGQGLLWGCLFRGEQKERQLIMRIFRRQCLLLAVWPYFVPIGGFQVTPLYDSRQDDLVEGLARLAECVHRTRAEHQADESAQI